MLIAESQTGGRGRLGRSFFSPDDTGIYMSLLLRPSVSPKDTTLITTAAAVSVCVAFEKAGVEKPQIKWVNDIFVNNKKVCGILTEASFKNNCETDYAVLGVGINFYEPKNSFPEDLENIAGAVFKNEKENLKNKFIADFLNCFYDFYIDLQGRSHIDEYRKRCVCLGREIKIISPDGERNATAIDVTDDCGLSVILPNGESRVIFTGEISIKL